MIADLHYYFSRFMRRIHYLLVVFICVVSVGAMFAFTLPETYRAEARLLVESPQIPDDLAASTVRAEASELLSVIQQRIFTRANLIEMSQRFDVYQDVAEMSADEVVNDMSDRIAIEAPISIDGTGLVSVSFEAESGATSAEVTNELLVQILRQNVAMRTEAASETLEFFENEVERLNSELAEQGARILEFQMEHSDALPEGLDFQRSRVTALQERILQINREFASLTDRRVRLEQLFEQTGRVDLSDASMSPEQRRLRELQGELASALIIYSPNYPRVISLQTQVEALEERIRAQTGPNAEGSELQTAYSLQIADIDGQIAFLSEQREEIEAEMDVLMSAINATPENAIELGKLERDYDNIRAQFNQATMGLAEARTGERIESLAKGQRIVVIEEASVPEFPSSPNRRLIIAASIGAGAVVVVALFLLLEMMSATIKRPIQITNDLGVKPFATVPYIVDTRQVVRRRLLITLLVLAVALGVPWILNYVHTQVMPLGVMLEELRQMVGI